MNKMHATLRETLLTVDRELAKLMSVRRIVSDALSFYQPVRGTTKRKMSAKGKAAIVKAQKARWKRYHKTNGKVLHMRKAG